MRRSKRLTYSVTSIAVLMLIFIMAGSAHAAFDCAAGAKEPPFLAPGIPPNLLLMIDNSASMLDMAFIAEGGECYDGTTTDATGATVDSYATGTAYAGYFDNDTWYEYNGSQFAAMSAAPSSTTGCLYFNDGDSNTVPDDVCVTIDGTTDPVSVTFQARGNFMNWATASKFDIEKKVLTGGKYDATNQRLVMEHRGCNKRRFIKQVMLEDASGNTNFMDLGIHPASDTDDTTVIDLFQINTTGFDYQDCQDAIDEMADPNTSLGTLKGDIDDCMEYADNQSYTEPQNPAFNQAVQTCWWWDSKVTSDLTAEEQEALIWDHNHAISLMNHCESMYDTMDPTTIDPDTPGYVCAGVYSDTYFSSEKYVKTDPVYAYPEAAGYAGRCWVPEQVSVAPTQSFEDCTEIDGSYSLPGTYTEDNGYRCIAPAVGSAPVVHECSGNYNANQGTCNKPWLPIIKETGGTGTLIPGHWVENGNDCVIQALIDFCGSLNIVELVDPYDATQSTGAVWNLPAMIVDVGISGQLGDPLYTMTGHIQQTSAPTGLLNDPVKNYANRIRFGVMAFNDDGSAYECNTTGIDPYITYSCESGTSKDGGYIITAVGAGNVNSLVSGINDTVADSWTPLAEAFMNAIAYYTQDSSMRLDPSDFTIDATAPPCTEWCQSNNILIITEGASTADLNSAVTGFAYPDADGTDDPAGCGILNGSSYLDDLTSYAKTGVLNYQYTDTDSGGKSFQNISTFIVRTGTPRNIGTGECAPDTLLHNAAENGGLGNDATERLANSYLDASDPSTLYDRLDQVFSDLAARAASGSAASVISSSSSGEGAVYQAIFWPKTEADEDLNTEAAYWTGEVHSLFIDTYGHIREDGDEDATLDNDGDCQSTDTDRCVDLFFDGSEGQNRTRACYDGTLSDDDNDGVYTCTGTIKELEEVNYLWSAAEWLGRVSDANIVSNRLATSYLSATPQRYIFTWIDKDRDGVVDYGDSEVMDFADMAHNSFVTNWSTLGSFGYAPVAVDFGVTTHNADSTARATNDINADVDAVVNWVRGKEDAALRNRTVPTPAGFSDISATTMPWRLGDVVNSTPTLVSRPVDAYNLLYQDSSYSDFYEAFKNRRQVVYFGGNDGMLHAVNAGFYDPATRSFQKSYTPASGTTPASYGNSGPDLGAELWAYVPYNLLPHLKCLTDPNYVHKYYVDMKPRIFDVRLWSDTDTVHERGWGTILVVGMRFGGALVSPQDIDASYSSDDREFRSAYIIMDITDPDEPPVLMGEMTFTDASIDFGYTTGAPTVVPMKNGADDYDWYLVLGSGPTDVSGAITSTQTAKVGIFPLKRLLGSSPAAFTIGSGTPTQTAAGSYEVPESNTGTTIVNGFVSDMITVDYDLVSNYKADVVYFGTIEGGYCVEGADTSVPCDDTKWGGKLYRLVTDEGTPDTWNIKMMIDVDRPVMAAPTVGFDDRGNYWVYFGTGRFYDILDKSDDSSNGEGDPDRFFGLKEYTAREAVTTTNRNGFLWPEIAYNVATTEKAPADSDDTTDGPGKRNLLRTDQIQVTEALYPTTATVDCSSENPSCLPASYYDSSGTEVSGVDRFDELVQYIVGNQTTTTSGSDITTSYSGTDGWVYEFQDERERNLGQSTLLGGLITFTTYQPFVDLCESEGYTYLYGLYYQTGTGWYQDVFYNDEDIQSGSEPNPAEPVTTRLSLGKGMSTTPNLHVGQQSGSTAFVQTSTGAIIEIEQPNLPLKNTKTGRISWRSE